MLTPKKRRNRRSALPKTALPAVIDARTPAEAALVAAHEAATKDRTQRAPTLRKQKPDGALEPATNDGAVAGAPRGGLRSSRSRGAAASDLAGRFGFPAGHSGRERERGDRAHPRDRAAGSGLRGGASTSPCSGPSGSRSSMKPALGSAPRRCTRSSMCCARSVRRRRPPSSRKLERDPAWGVLRTIPFLGPVRVALLLATLQTPWRFRSRSSRSMPSRARPTTA